MPLIQHMRSLQPQILVLALLALFSAKSPAQEKATVSPLDADSRAFVAALAESQAPGFHELPPVAAREAFASLTELFGKGPDDVTAKDSQFDGVPVRIYKPKGNSSNKLPVILFFHGGGWVLGSIETHDALCRRLCSESQAAVVSVDYRLAPEHPFPAPLDDCFNATQHVHQHAERLGLDADRIAVAGDSAGGNLAAAVALKARNAPGPRLRAQVLIYPAVDSDCDTASYTSFADGYGLTKESMQWFWKQYVGEGTRNVYASPSKAKTLRGLPETVLITAQFDVLRDEGEAYAKKLENAGVTVSHRRYDGVVHGFVHFAGAFEKGKQATSHVAQELKRIFASPQK